MKENTDCPSTDGGGAPNAADIVTGYVGSANGTVAGVEHTFLYLGWDRAAVEGTFTVSFELNSGTVSCVTDDRFVERVPGVDLLFEYEFQGGTTIGVSVRTWTADGVWSDPTILPSTKAEASISGDQLFGELVVDMTAAGFFAPGVCKGFSSAMMRTRSSSSSFENQLKDMILPFPIEVTNCGSLTVTKTVDGPNGSFQFTVDCGTFDLNGEAAGDDLSFALGDGGSRKIDDIPLGKVCTVTETSPGATSWTTTYKIGSGSSQTGLTASGIEIALGNKTVAFTNTRITGSLTITKAASGGTGSFSFDIDCSVDSFDRSNVSAGPGEPYVLTGIPTGTTCTVTEDANGDFTQTLVVPADGTVTIDSNGETVAFTNVRNVGSLTITKAANAAGSFTFDVNCSVDSFDRSNVSAGPGEPYVLSGIPTGTTCTVTEDANGDFTQTLVVPADGTVTIDADGETVAFTNVRNTGGLTVSKTTSGGSGTFTFTVDCDGTAYDQDVEITNNGSVTIPGIPTGTSCTVTEEGDPLFTSVLVSDSNTVLIDANGETVSFRNTRKTGSLTIVKTTNGGTGTFTFDVDCGSAFDQTVEITNSGSVTIPDIPTGTTCTVTERDNPLFSSIVVPDDGTVQITTQGRTVAFTNTRNTGPLTISKTAIGGTGTFTFDVDCSGNAFDQVVTIEGSGSRTITGIPTTTSCTVTERSNPLFTSSVLPANGTVSIDAGGENVAFVNTAKPNGLTIDKKVNGGDHATVGDALLVHVADALSYTVVITNNGQVPLTITAMSDSLYPDLIAACPQAVGSVLAAGASFTCRYGVGAIGDAHNVVAVSAVDGLGRPLTGSDGTYVDVLNPAITIVKTANPVSISVSGSVTYSYVVTNTGDTTLQDILVTDDIIGAIGQIPELAPGESVTLTKTVDVDASTPPTNIGTAVGADVLGLTVTASDDATITVVLAEVLVLPAELPRTGSPLQAQTRAALALIQVGLVLTLAGRRRWMVRRAG